MYMCYCKTKTLASLKSGNICDEYFDQYLGGEALGELVTVVITVINIIIKFICRILISWIGYATLTADITAYMCAVYITTFFNTAILLLLADANLSQVKVLSWLPGLQKGPFPDLTEEWYLVIAPSLILTMFLNAISPLIEVSTYVISGAIKKSLD